MINEKELETVNFPLRPLLVVALLAMGLLAAAYAGNRLLDRYLMFRLDSLLEERGKRLQSETGFDMDYIADPIVKRKHVGKEVPAWHEILASPAEIHNYSVSFIIVDLCQRNRECREYYRKPNRRADVPTMFRVEHTDERKEVCTGHVRAAEKSKWLVSTLVLSNNNFELLEVCASLLVDRKSALPR